MPKRRRDKGPKRLVPFSSTQRAPTKDVIPQRVALHRIEKSMKDRDAAIEIFGGKKELSKFRREYRGLLIKLRETVKILGARTVSKKDFAELAPKACENIFHTMQRLEEFYFIEALSGDPEAVLRYGLVQKCNAKIKDKEFWLKLMHEGKITRGMKRAYRAFTVPFMEACDGILGTRDELKN